MTINDQASTSSTPRTDERYPNLKPMLMRYDATIERLRAEVERLRAALQDFADPKNWQVYVDDMGGETGPVYLGPGLKDCTIEEVTAHAALTHPGGPMSGDTPRTDERWLPDDPADEIYRLRAQLEQTERDYAAFRQAVDGKTADWPEKLDRIAARLEQTKKERDAAKDAGWDWMVRANELTAEVERLRAALRFYADPENHHWQQKEHEDGERYTKASSFVDEDGGERARRALTPQEDR